MFKESMTDLMEKAKKMQETLEKTQSELLLLEVVGESGAGLVRIIQTGKYEVKKVEIDKNLLGESKEIIEDFIKAAMNDANNKLAKITKERLSGVSTKMGLPPGMKWPF